MAQAQTGRFGTLEYDSQSEIAFPYGIPGFDHERRFLLVEQTSLAPFVFLQSLDSPDLCFAALPASAIDVNYELQLSAEDRSALLQENQLNRDLLEEAPLEKDPLEDSPVPGLLPLALLAAAGDGPLTANLLAPVVINLTRRIGLQTIRSDARYSHCHRLGAGVPCW